MKSDFRFHHSLRVRFAETDMQGIVFNGNYLTYYDVAWTEYFRAVGLEWRDILATGADTVLARTTLEFKAPSRFDEILEIYVRVAKIGNTSLAFEFEVYAEASDRLLNAASSVYVCVDPSTLRPIQVPETLRRAIREFEGKTEA
jgi:acyl-CoA thioester hydrolase